MMDRNDWEGLWRWLTTPTEFWYRMNLKLYVVVLVLLLYWIGKLICKI